MNHESNCHEIVSARHCLIRLARRLTRMVVPGTFLGAFLFAAISENASAASEKIETLSLARIPIATTVEIRHPIEEGSDDLGLTVSLAGYFSNNLTERGYTLVAGDAELIFRFDAEEPTFAQLDDRSQHARLGADEMWFDRHGAGIQLVASADTVELAESHVDTYRLRVSVARARRPPLWTGYIERSVAGADRRLTYLTIAKRLMAHWGQSYSGMK